MASPKSRWDDWSRKWAELPIEAKLGTVIVPLLIAALYAFISIVTAPGDAERPGAAGRIISPVSGEEVSRAFMVQGSLSGVPGDRHVWLAVQIGNRLTPKEPEIPVQDRGWAQEVTEAGHPAGRRFTLALLMVDAAGQRTIEEWLRRGRSTGDYPAFERIEGSVKLHTVGNLVLR